MQEIHITIDKDGKVVIDVHGVVGVSCTDLTALLERELGEVVAREFKPEMYQDGQPGRVGIGAMK